MPALDIRCQSFLITCLSGMNFQKDRLLDFNEMDWEGIIRTAERNSLAPLLYHRLRSNPQIVVPPAIMDRLRMDFLHSAARNTEIFRELDRLIDLFDQSSLNLIPLKGAYLARSIYDHIALRPMGDLDLLVRQSDLDQFKNILNQEGYRSDPSAADYYDKHLPVFQKPGAPAIEIHFTVVEKRFAPNFNIEDFWKRSHKEQFGDHSIHALQPEDLLLHLCLHAAAWDADEAPHPIIRPRQLVDVREVLSHYHDQFKWNLFIGRAKDLGGLMYVYLTLALANAVLNIGIDAQLKELRPVSFDDRLLHKTRRAIDYLLQNDIGGLIPETLIHFRLAETWREKFTLIWHTFFPSNTRLSRRYHIPANSPDILWRRITHPVYIIGEFFKNKSAGKK